MPKFRYQIQGDEGRSQPAEITADSEAEARRILAEKNIEPVNLTLLPQTIPALLVGEAEELAQHVATVSEANLPLATGLRAAAQEAQSRRLRSSLNYLASQLDQGISLGAALAATNTPEHLQRLLDSAAKGGSLSQRLNDLLEHYRTTRETWRLVTNALVYPCMILACSVFMYLIVQWIVIAPFREVYDEFELDLSSPTSLIFWWSEHGSIWLTSGLAISVVVTLLTRLVVGKARFRSILSTLPIIGPLWHWTGVAEFSRLLGAMIQERISLPEALRLTGDGLSDPQIAASCTKMAHAISAGKTLSSVISREGGLPATLGPLLHWGEQHDSIAEACQSAAELFETRARMRAALIRRVAPPSLLFVVVVNVILIIASLLTPLMGLIRWL